MEQSAADFAGKFAAQHRRFGLYANDATDAKGRRQWSEDASVSYGW